MGCMGAMNTKHNEKKYIDNLTKKEKTWLYNKPFGNYNFQESFLRIRDFSYIIELLSLQTSRKYSLLDLGCGPGWTSIMMAKLEIMVTGIDISEAMIAIAKERTKKEGLKINFLVSDIEKIDFENQFDRVLSYDALHHCPNELEVLKNIYKALKPGGLVLIVEPNKKHYHNKKTQKIAQRFGILEKGYTPYYLKREMKKIGFKKIIRYHCNYGINKPSKDGIVSLIRQVVRLVITRVILAHYQSQVWVVAKK